MKFPVLIFFFAFVSSNAANVVEDAISAIGASSINGISKQIMNNMNPSNMLNPSNVLSSSENFVGNFHDVLKGITAVEKLVHGTPQEKSKPGNINFRQTFENVGALFDDMKSPLNETFQKLGNWVNENWDTSLQLMRENQGLINFMAMEFIEQSKSVNGELAEEALNFFKDHKEELGKLYKDVVRVAEKAIKRAKAKNDELDDEDEEPDDEDEESDDEDEESDNGTNNNFIEHSKSVNGELAEEALNFFRDHKEELGKLYKDAVSVAEKTIKRANTERDEIDDEDGEPGDGDEESDDEDDEPDDEDGESDVEDEEPDHKGEEPENGTNDNLLLNKSRREI